MKICFLMNHIIMGGLEKVLCEYIKSLKNMGIDVCVVSKDTVKDSYFLDLFNKYDIKLFDKIFPQNHVHFFIRKFIYKCFIKIKLNRIYKNSDCIIDFANFSFSKLLRGVSVTKIGWCHGSINVFNMLYAKHNIEQYDKIVCLTESCKNDVINTYPNLIEKVVQIYNPIDIKNVQQLSKQQVPIKKPYFVAVQRLDTDKDVATIIKAFKIFSEKHPRYMLYIIGDGPQRAKLEELASINKNTIFTGKIDNPYPFIKNAEGLILSSTSTIGEGLGNTLLEAQILETLAISSDVKSGPREILLNGRAGVLFPVGDYKKLATVMAKIADKKYDFAKIIKVATDNLNRFSSENTINKIFNLINIKG